MISSEPRVILRMAGINAQTAPQRAPGRDAQGDQHPPQVAQNKKGDHRADCPEQQLPLAPKIKHAAADRDQRAKGHQQPRGHEHKGVGDGRCIAKRALNGVLQGLSHGKAQQSHQPDANQRGQYEGAQRDAQ